jgi:hypothetical protein
MVSRAEIEKIPIGARVAYRELTLEGELAGYYPEKPVVGTLEGTALNNNTTCFYGLVFIDGYGYPIGLGCSLEKVG